jgi:photosystem II stability/assembly factor-like uncharacterized protein
MVAIRLRGALSAVALLCWLQHAQAHDPSAWGGTFRSRDEGATWMPIDAGLFVGGAIGIAVNPLDPNDLLYATDTRLLRSRNGGRDWVQDPAPAFIGPTLAVAFSRDGKALLAATAGGIWMSAGDAKWQPANIASAATPALAIVPGARPEQFYVVGAQAAFRSDDHGAKWLRISEALPQGPTALVVASESARVLVLAQGSVYVSGDEGASWQTKRAGLPDGKLQMLAPDAVPKRVWAGGAGTLYRSDDSGDTWTQWGQALPEADTILRGVIATADANALSVSTHRGLYRSTDAGKSWQQVTGNLPVHLEAGAMVRDPHAPTTVYLPFSLTPYHEIRRRAVEGSNLLAQVDPISMAGAGAFFILFVVAAVFLVRKLTRLSERSPSSTGTS